MTAATNLGLEDDAHAWGSLRYHVGGEGEPLLLLHGLAGSAGELGRAAARARSCGTACSPLELPGPCAARRRCRRRATSTDFAAVAAAVLEAEGGSARHRRRPLVRRARRAPARAQPARARARPAAGRRPPGSRRDASRAGDRVASDDDPRPADWVAPFRHRYAERDVVPPRALPALVRLRCRRADAARATHGLLGAQRAARGHADRRAAR